MKKINCISIILVLLAWLMPLDAVAANVNGDVNGDGEVNKNRPKYLFNAEIFQDDNLLTYKSVLKDCLNELFIRIFDADTPFAQTEHEEDCKNCDFLHLCGRQTVTESRK